MLAKHTEMLQDATIQFVRFDLNTNPRIKVLEVDGENDYPALMNNDIKMPFVNGEKENLFKKCIWRMLR